MKNYNVFFHHVCDSCLRKDRNCPVVGNIESYAKSCIHKSDKKDVCSFEELTQDKVSDS
jgi:hypothetical protein